MVEYEILSCPHCKRPIPTRKELIVGLTTNMVILRCDDCNFCFDVDREEYLQFRSLMISKLFTDDYNKDNEYKYLLTNN